MMLEKFELIRRENCMPVKIRGCLYEKESGFYSKFIQLRVDSFQCCMMKRFMFEFVAKSSEPELILWYFKIQSINDFLNLCEVWEKKIKIHVFSISCIFSNTIRSFDAHCDKLAS